MLKNFIQITLRNLMRDKTYLVLNLLGLSLGVAGSILILLYVRHELSYDDFHEKSAQIYRINCYVKLEGKEISVALTAPPQAKAFMAEFPEIENATRFYYPSDQKVTVNNITYHEKNFFYADSNYYQIFNFALLKGDPNTALTLPYSVVLTREMALKLFGTDDVLGRDILLNNDKPYRVTGVAATLPGNTHFRTDYLASFSSLDLSKSEFWLSQMLETYIVLQKDLPYEALEAKFESLMDKYVLPQVEMLIPIKATSYKEFEATGNFFRFTLQPLTEIHFNTQYILGYDQGTDKSYVYFFSIVALFLLFIACINFTNLATAKYSYRTKEVGVKKVVGSTRGQLIRQFLSESMIISTFAVVLALTLVEIVLPFFNNFTGKNLAIGYLSHWYAIPGLILLIAVIGTMSGIYPAFYLSSFKPVEILKSRFSGGPGNIRLRSALVVGQFTITIILLISTFIVSSQLNYIRTKNLGFEKENVLIVKNTGDLGEQSESFSEQVRKISGVLGASRSWTFPGDNYYGSTFQLQSDSLNRMYHFEIIQGDYDFIPTLGFDVVQGRNFSREFPTDQSAVLINEKAVGFLGLSEPLGAKLTTPNDKGGQDVYEIIGVIRDVHYKTLHERIEPMLIGYSNDNNNAYTLIKIQGDVRQILRDVDAAWKDFLPSQPMEYTFLDQNFDTLYKMDSRAGSIFVVFTALAIFVACLGLLGLSAFAAAKRTKEIGVRKVHGASVTVILRLLSKEIIVLITISSVIAWPLVYYIMQEWLKKFAYKTDINLLIFAVSSLIGLAIAISVVVYQSLHVAKINPVEALKYE